MGFTHYFYRIPNLEQKAFNSFSKDVNKIYKAAKKKGIDLADGSGEIGTLPIANKLKIDFNGVGDDSHESLIISRFSGKNSFRKDEQLVFGFCKTVRKPYDLIVTAVLVSFKHYFPHAKIESDGKVDAFTKGKELCNELFGYGSDFEYA